MIYIAICDDNEKSVIALKDRVVSYTKKNNVIADITTYTQSRILQFDIQEGKYFDIILSDIEMPHIDGMNLAEYIKKYLPEVLVIFITSYLKYAIDAFELSIFRYIPKNMIDDRLNHALQDAIKLIENQSDKFYFIQMPSRVQKIPFQRILYIQREGKNSVLTLIDNTETRVRRSLAQVMGELDPHDFVYVDRGSIVNLSYIMKIKDDIVEMKNGTYLMASHAKAEQIKLRLSEFWSEKI